MRRLIPAVAVLLVLVFSETAAAVSCTSLASGAWQTAGTWDCNKRPVAGDTVTVAASHEVTVSQAEAATTLTFGSGSRITFSGAFTLAVAGDATVVSTGATVDGPGTLDITG